MVNGCESPSEYGVWTDMDGNDYSRCPINYVPDTVWKFLEKEKYKKIENVSGKQYNEQSAVYTRYKMFYSDELDTAKAYKDYLTKEKEKNKI